MMGCRCDDGIIIRAFLSLYFAKHHKKRQAQIDKAVKLQYFYG